MSRQESRDPSDMVRFVIGPENLIYPDIKAKLPGRGVWVSATRKDLQSALDKNAFSRGFKSKVTVPDNLIEQVETALKRHILALLAMAKKSGKLFIGFDQVMAAARSEGLAWRIEASDGAEGSRGKIRTLSKAIAQELEMPLPRVIGCYDSREIGHILGRDSIIHCALPPGKFARSMGQNVNRLAGFVPLFPEGWADAQHEAF